MNIQMVHVIVPKPGEPIPTPPIATRLQHPVRENKPQTRDLTRNQNRTGQTINSTPQSATRKSPDIAVDKDAIGPDELMAQSLLNAVDRRLDALLAKSPEEQIAIREMGRLWNATRIRKGISWRKIHEETYLNRTAVIMLEVGLLPEKPEDAQNVINRMNGVLGLAPNS